MLDKTRPIISLEGSGAWIDLAKVSAPEGGSKKTVTGSSKFSPRIRGKGALFTLQQRVNAGGNLAAGATLS